MAKVRATIVLLSLLATSQPVVAQEQAVLLTRSEAAAAIVMLRTTGTPKVVNTGKIKDVRKGDWYEPYSLIAAERGIISVDPISKLLRPDANVTRVEFLKMISTAFGLGEELPSHFKDIDPYEWYAHYAGLAYTYRLFPRDSDQTTLKPHQYISQNEAIFILNRAVMLRKEMLAAQIDPHLVEDMETARKQTSGELKLLIGASGRTTHVILGDTPFDPIPFQQETIVARPDEPKNVQELRVQIEMMLADIRKEHDLEPLTPNNLLDESAQIYADDMSKRNFFSHVSPEGQTIRDRIQATGYYNRAFTEECQCVKGYALGENLARGQATAREAVEAWMASPHHREAILNGEYDEVGIGVAAQVWVLHFGGVIMPL